MKSKKKAKINYKFSIQELEEKKKELLNFRKELPIYEVKDQLLKEIEEHPVLIIIGETGSGKTTQIPQFIFESKKIFPSSQNDNQMIGITQPRRVAAISVANRVAEELGTNLGDKVGYSVRFDDLYSENTKIKYLTDGMLLREIIMDPLLRKYKVLIIDEAHERTLNTDLLLALLKNLKKQRLELKIIVMSATLEAELFEEFFKAKVLYIEGRQYPVDIMYTINPQEDFIDSTFTTILQIHFCYPPGAILVFLPGKENIETLELLLFEKSQLFPENLAKFQIIKIHASLPNEEQLKIFEKERKHLRKVVLATNVAETSITIPGIKYVVDPGLVKSRALNTKLGIDTLTTIPISKASARQRSGRAGRDSAGICFRLFTENDFVQLNENSISEIKRTNLDSLILLLNILGVEDILNFEFLEEPPLEHVKRSLIKLTQLGAFEKSGKLSLIGRQLAQLPLQPMYGKVLLESKKFGCTEEVLEIISMLSVETEDFFFVPKGKEKQAQFAKQKFFSSEGDHFFLLNIFNHFKKSKFSQNWCIENFLNMRHIFFAKNIKEQLLEYCQKLEIPISNCQLDPDPIRKCFMHAFFMNFSIYSPDLRIYVTEGEKKNCQIHPMSILAGKKSICVLFNELVFTKKHYMRNVMEIDLNEMRAIQRSVSKPWV